MTARAAALLALAACGCDLERTVGLSTDPASVQSIDRPLRFAGRDRIDVLAMIDDSGSMAPKQALLTDELPVVLDALASANAQRSVRLGVITSDVGAPGIACGQDRGGRLQAIGAGAQAGCLAPVGTPWLSLSAAGDNAPAGQSVVDTIRCMSSVGDKGCGFEMPLEAVRRQLTDPPPDGEPFVRDDALLVILFVTDEDDCSTAQGSDLFTNPAYGPLASFRCSRYGILCGGGLISDAPAVYDDCRAATPADGGKLVDLSTYMTLLGEPRAAGGIKDDPADLVVAALDAAPSPFITTTGTGTDVCGQGVSSCTVLAHSCLSPSDSALFGDPAVRLDAVVKSLGGLSRSICDTSYQPFATDLVARVEAAASGNACLPGAVADPGAPDCTVTADGAPLPPCQGVLDGGRCWIVDGDPSCPTQVDPRDGSAQALHMRIVSAPLASVSASCRVLVAQ